MQNYYELKCEHCNKQGKRTLKDRPGLKKWKGLSFCNKDCKNAFYNTCVTKNCGWCNNNVVRVLSQCQKSTSGLIFCNRSCSVSYNNTQKRKSRRSKCEILLFELLTQKYPQIEILPNDKTLFNGYEIDIAIPSLNLAIEWNGIVHFKPIYGQDKLDNIQTRDKEKQIIAERKKINFIVIPDLVSTKTYVNEAFHKICKIIDTL